MCPEGAGGDEYPTAIPFMPESRSLRALKSAANGCRGCPLYREATQAVFGEGLVRSRIMLVGEMPGNDEDLAGRPFVGPAGRVLDEALVESGIARDDAYVTNVVKHFKWEPRGRRRLHKTPSTREVRACLPWLDAEIERIAPEVLVALGSTAAKTLIGPGYRVTREHGQFVESDRAPLVTATIHPSAVLRSPTREARAAQMRQLIGDFGKIRDALNGGGR